MDGLLAPSTVLVLAGKVFPEPLHGATGACASAGECTGRLLASCLGSRGWVGGLTGGLVGRLVGTAITWSAWTGWGSQHCSFLIGGRIPQTPCVCERFVCVGRRVHCVVCMASYRGAWRCGRGIGDGTGPLRGGTEVHGAPRCRRHGGRVLLASGVWRHSGPFSLSLGEC